ncbi:hypothetical protein [Photobacterium lutimaris]|uniref:FAD-binding FR-type domain-containing protein n=1 Tax=Photobacterium lutimaris TaxID=388278 RepID=A0A2T3J2N7_9GAMM|nr:hypothetical protein [Photobacterium lutimaris]PSU35562.1 hypothetical protein C9I99_00640 [Photobacterium lutimaris]TDR78613.1 aquacobalamin reductase/NAD(P)H-flavin reductase [Photobacterium lutimaris]
MERTITQSTTPFKFVSMEWLNAHTLSLKLQPERPYPYRAGQYLALPLPASQKSMPFSIASKPTLVEGQKGNDHAAIEIQIGGVLPNSDLALDIAQFRSHWLHQQSLFLGPAAGDAYFRETNNPITVIAGGSGFSYAKSVVLEALSQPDTSSITLYWGAKSLADLYEHEAMMALSKQHPQFEYVPVVESLSSKSKAKAGDATKLHQGKLLDIFFANTSLKEEQDIYLCGRYQMVQTAYQQIVAINPELANRVHSDALPPQSVREKNHV